MTVKPEEHPKGSGKWRVRPRIDGKLHTVISGVSLAEAEEAALAYVHVKHDTSVREGVTLAQFGEALFARRERDGVRGVKRERYRWNKHVARKPIGTLAVAGIRRRDVLDWLDGLGGSHRSRKRNLTLLTVALADAVEREILEVNPARDVEVHKSGGATDRDDLEGILTPAEQQALMSAVPDAYRGLVAFALCTGLRQAEQWWLTWDNVGKDHVMVRKSTGGLPPKSGKPRRVFLLSPALSALEHPGKRRKFVFPAPKGGRRQEGKAPRAWPKWVKAAGIKRHIRWHDLRHTCATALLAGWWGRKWTLDEVCSLLGHSSVQVTERYAKKLAETQQNAVAQTPQFEFPSGDKTGGKSLTTQHKSSAFVKHRSRVQISQSAPQLTAPEWERAGNFGESRDSNQVDRLERSEDRRALESWGCHGTAGSAPFPFFDARVDARQPGPTGPDPTAFAHGANGPDGGGA